MARRFPVAEVRVGRLALSAAESHHARAVMRLTAGDTMEVFDAAGRTAQAIIASAGEIVEVEVASVRPATERRLRLTIASAVPKGPRADWLVEKLAEIGVDEFVPLQTTRSVVHPEGTSKLQRWERLAGEAAKQSHRQGAMRIAELTPLGTLLAGRTDLRWHLSTAEGAVALQQAMASAADHSELLVCVGPEGGWSPEEESELRGSGSVAVALTGSILRIETAGLVAAGAILSFYRQ